MTKRVIATKYPRCSAHDDAYCMRQQQIRPRAERAGIGAGVGAVGSALTGGMSGQVPWWAVPSVVPPVD